MCQLMGNDRRPLRLPARCQRRNGVTTAAPVGRRVKQLVILFRERLNGDAATRR